MMMVRLLVVLKAFLHEPLNLCVCVCVCVFCCLPHFHFVARF